MRGRPGRPPTLGVLTRCGARAGGARSFRIRRTMLDREDDPKIDIRTSDITFGCIGAAAKMICHAIIRRASPGGMRRSQSCSPRPRPAPGQVPELHERLRAGSIPAMRVFT